MRHPSRLSSLLLALGPIGLAAGCATPPPPTLDKLLPPQVAIQTVPSSCSVQVDGADRGVSPLVFSAASPEAVHKLLFAHEGYLPAEVSLSGEEIKSHSGLQVLVFLRPGIWDPKSKPIDSDNAVQLTRAGQDLAKATRCPEALPYLKRALEIDPRLAQAHKALGTCYAKMGKSNLALEEYKAYLLYAPEAPDADKVRQIVDAAQGDIEWTPPAKGE